MTDKLTAARLGELLAGATKGPWFDQYEYNGGRTVCTMRSTDTTYCVNATVDVEENPCQKFKANAALIVALVNAAEQIRGLLEREEAATTPVGDWKPCDQFFEDTNLVVDGVVVGWVTAEGNGCWTAHADTLDFTGWDKPYPTEAEARAAVEAAVRGGK